MPVALLPLVLAAIAGSAPARALPAQPTISALAWLAGGWGGSQDGVATEEHWTSAAGDGLIGMHKDVKDGKMISFEFLRIDIDAQGRICYLAMPDGAPATSFCAAEIAEKRVVFENRAHDFPQRILYWLDSGGKLHARIEGPPGAGDGDQEWIWSRLPD